MGFGRRSRIAGVVTALAVTALAGASALGAEEEDEAGLRHKAFKSLVSASRALADADEGDVRRARRVLDRLLARDDLNATERAAALELRARAALLAKTPDHARALADLDASIASGGLRDRERAAARDLIVSVLARTQDWGAITARYDLDPAVFSESEPETIGAIATALAIGGRASEALGLLRERTGGERPDPALLASRYAMAVRMQAWREAEAALTAYAASHKEPFGPVVQAQEALAVLRTTSPDQAALRDHARGFLRAEQAEREANRDAQPLVRLPPTGFTSCFTNARRGRFDRLDERVKVEVEFDVTPEGRTEDILIRNSDDRCFDSSARRAVASWEYEPKTVEGRAVRREGVRTTVIFVAP